MMISTRQLLAKDLDSYLVYDGEVVSLYGKTEQADGSHLIQLEHADASGSKFEVHVPTVDMDADIWDYDDNDC